MKLKQMILLIFRFILTTYFVVILRESLTRRFDLPVQFKLSFFSLYFFAVGRFVGTLLGGLPSVFELRC
jgi:hypothetical protein